MQESLRSYLQSSLSFTGQRFRHCVTAMQPFLCIKLESVSYRAVFHLPGRTEPNIRPVEVSLFESTDDTDTATITNSLMQQQQQQHQFS